MNSIKCLLVLPVIACVLITTAQSSAANDDKKTFEQTIAAIRDAFARGNVAAIVSLHHPDVVKYFGGNNVVTRREGLAKQLTDMFGNAKVEFISNDQESLIFSGETAIRTSVFTIKSTPKNSGEATIFKGRAMVVFVRYKESPTGWVSNK